MHPERSKTWSLQYTDQNPKAFLDCMAFWNATLIDLDLLRE